MFLIKGTSLRIELNKCEKDTLMSPFVILYSKADESRSWSETWLEIIMDKIESFWIENLFESKIDFESNRGLKNRNRIESWDGKRFPPLMWKSHSTTVFILFLFLAPC